MARGIKSEIDKRTKRLELPKRDKPYFVVIAKGIALGYRTSRLHGTSGAWLVRSTSGKQWQAGFATADDYEGSNGDGVLSYEEAIERARDLARAGPTADPNDVTDGRPITLQQAFDDYADDLAARGKDPYNARLGATHIEAALLAKPVMLLRSGELKKYRDGLRRKGHKACSVNRIICPLKAALELAALNDPRVRNQDEWRRALKPLEDDSEPRNVVLAGDEVRTIVAAAYVQDEAFGRLVEFAASCGARYSQLGRIRVRDLHIGRGEDCFVMIPTSHKGRGKRKFEGRRFPLARDHALRLQRSAGGRAPNDPLLIKGDGTAWEAGDQQDPFAAALKAAGIEPTREGLPVTMGALRHTSITQMLAKGVDESAVANAHDTSVAMLRRTYAINLDKHIDAQLRAALPDLAPKPAIVVAHDVETHQAGRESRRSRRRPRSAAAYQAAPQGSSLRAKSPGRSAGSNAWASKDHRSVSRQCFAGARTQATPGSPLPLSPLRTDRKAARFVTEK